MSRPSRDDVDQELTEQHLMISRVIAVAFALGGVAYLGVAVFMSQSVVGGNGDGDLVRTLSIVALALAVVTWVAATFVPPYNLANSVATATNATQVVSAFRTALIVRLTLYEAPALFGLVVWLLAAQGGILRALPIYWVNVFPLLVLLATVFLNWPTREKVLDAYEDLRRGSRD